MVPLSFTSHGQFKITRAWCTVFFTATAWHSRVRFVVRLPHSRLWHRLLYQGLLREPEAHVNTQHCPRVVT